MLGRRHRSDDERVPRKDRMGASPVVVGVVVLVVACIGVFFGFAKHVPFTHGFRVKAVFESSNSIRKNSPVRIAGVNVGKVVKVEGKPGSDAAVVTMDVTKQGPADPQGRHLQDPPADLPGGQLLRRRHAGHAVGADHRRRRHHPDHPDGDAGAARPGAERAAERHAHAACRRRSDGLGTGLNYKPSKAQDTDADPSARGESGGQSLNDAIRYGERSLKGTAIVADAFLGDRGPRPLAAHRRAEPHHRGPGAQRAWSCKDLVTNFNTTVAATASQAANLSASIRLLGPTLQNADRALDSLNASFPNTRAFAREILPGVNETAATIDAAFPWIAQARGLLGPSELQGVAARAEPGHPRPGQGHQRDAWRCCRRPTWWPSAPRRSCCRPAT